LRDSGGLLSSGRRHCRPPRTAPPSSSVEGLFLLRVLSTGSTFLVRYRTFAAGASDGNDLGGRFGLARPRCHAKARSAGDADEPAGAVHAELSASVVGFPATLVTSSISRPTPCTNQSR
jgi:hypothetical protein